MLETRPVFAPIAGTELLRKEFRDRIGPFLNGPSGGQSKLREAAYAGEYFSSLAGQLPEAAGPAVTSLAAMCDQRRQFDLQARLHAWLHGWLWIHLPLSVMLLVLLVVHVVVALKYW